MVLNPRILFHWPKKYYKNKKFLLGLYGLIPHALSPLPSMPTLHPSTPTSSSSDSEPQYLRIQVQALRSGIPSTHFPPLLLCLGASSSSAHSRVTLDCWNNAKAWNWIPRSQKDSDLFKLARSLFHAKGKQGSQPRKLQKGVENSPFNSSWSSCTESNTCPSSPSILEVSSCAQASLLLAVSACPFHVQLSFPTPVSASRSSLTSCSNSPILTLLMVAEPTQDPEVLGYTVTTNSLSVGIWKQGWFVPSIGMKGCFGAFFFFGSLTTSMFSSSSSESLLVSSSSSSSSGTFLFLFPESCLFPFLSCCTFHSSSQHVMSNPVVDYLFLFLSFILSYHVPYHLHSFGSCWFGSPWHHHLATSTIAHWLWRHR